MKNRFKILTIIYISSVIIFLQYGTSYHPFTVSVYITDKCTISTIPLEAYVMGVVSAEMPSDFHIEALKAQAVASRTYAVAKIKSGKNPETHPMAPLCDTTHCQVYANYSASDPGSPKIKKAVKETASQLLYYNNELVENALYHSSSGGYTENSEDVFVSAIPYLRSVSSPYEANSPRNGHGVGMSQQGANGMAEAGFDYKKILSHYYSGTVVD